MANLSDSRVVGSTDGGDRSSRLRRSPVESPDDCLTLEQQDRQILRRLPFCIRDHCHE